MIPYQKFSHPKHYKWTLLRERLMKVDRFKTGKKFYLRKRPIEVELTRID